MIFCPECKSILRPVKKKTKVIMTCSCGYASESKDTRVIEKIKDQAKSVEVIDKEIETNPECEAVCEKCENKIATYWFIQTRAGDEAATKFLQCTKCKHRWREY